MRAHLTPVTRSSKRRLLAGLLAVVGSGALAAALLTGGASARSSDYTPVMYDRPLVGGLVPGQTLSVFSPGNWAAGSAISYTYNWVWSDGRGNWTPIPGATQSTYTVTSADVGKAIFVQVKATNASGQYNFANSPETPIVQSPGASTTGGQTTIQVTAVTPPNRLSLKYVSSTPATLSLRGSVVAKFQVTDIYGSPVQGAIVGIVGVPFGGIAGVIPQSTGTDGTVSFKLSPSKTTAKTPGGAVGLFAKAIKPGDSEPGVSDAQLVKLPFSQ